MDFKCLFESSYKSRKWEVCHNVRIIPCFKFKDILICIQAYMCMYVFEMLASSFSMEE